MNYDMDLMNRALMRAGQETLTDEDKEKETVKYRTVTAFYNTTLQLLLCESDWTSLKTRKQLTEETENKGGKYAYAYKLPVDCARPIEVDSNEPYVVEGTIIYTDVENPTLLYVTNHKREEVEALPETDEGQVLYGGKLYSWDSETESYTEDETQEDINEYESFTLSEELRECLEYHLASEIALKITGDANLYNLLMQIALEIEGRSRKTSRAQGMSRQKGHTWWSEKLGLTSDEEDNEYATY